MAGVPTAKLVILQSCPDYSGDRMQFDRLKRREFITLLGGAAVSWPRGARAQGIARYRIGHLAIAAPTDTPPPPPANWDAFVQGLREAGYTEGQNVGFSTGPLTTNPNFSLACIGTRKPQS